MAEGLPRRPIQLINMSRNRYLKSFVPSFVKFDVTARGLFNMNCSNAEKVNKASTSSTYNSQSVEPSYAVVLKNCRKDIRDPHDRKQFINSICKEASKEITDLKRKIVMRSKSAASKIAVSMNAAQPSISASMKKQVFAAVVK